MFRIVLAFAAGLMVCTMAQAAEYPNRVVKVISPFPAGSGGWIFAKLIVEPMAQSLKQPFVIESRAGARGEIAFAQAKRAPADGYTLFFGHDGQFTINVAAYEARGMKPPYDPYTDLAPIGVAVEGNFILLANKNLPVKNMQELAAYARANPGKLSMATPNPSGILIAALLKAQGFDVVAVPNQTGGAPQAILDLVGGHVQLYASITASSYPQMRSGEVKLIGTVGKKRDMFFPEVPTLGEQGFPAFDQIPISWGGLFAPRDTPREVLDILNKELVKSVAKKTTIDALHNIGIQPRYLSPKQTNDYIKEHIDSLVKVLKDTNTQLPVGN